MGVGSERRVVTGRVLSRNRCPAAVIELRDGGSGRNGPLCACAGPERCLRSGHSSTAAAPTGLPHHAQFHALVSARSALNLMKCERWKGKNL